MPFDVHDQSSAAFFFIFSVICTAWVDSINTGYEAAGLNTNPVKKYVFLSSLYEFLSTGLHLLRVSFITTRKSNLCTSVTTQGNTQNKCIISHLNKKDCSSAQCIFNSNTSATCHEKGTFDISHRIKPAKANCRSHTLTQC